MNVVMDWSLLYQLSGLLKMQFHVKVRQSVALSLTKCATLLIREGYTISFGVDYIVFRIQFRTFLKYLVINQCLSGPKRDV